MNQPKNEYEVTKATPSTPPLFGISSPDFKNFKTWIRTSPFTNDFDLSKDELQLSDMDFEAAYAMFTAKTPPVHHPSTDSVPKSNGPIGSAVPSPMTNYQSELTNQLHELHNHRADYNHKITSPGLSHLFQHGNSPNFQSPELENLAFFSNYDELLSVNESNAIEQFLDSIMDEQSSKNDAKKLEQEQEQCDESLHQHGSSSQNDHQTQLQPPLHPLPHLQPHLQSLKSDKTSHYESRGSNSTNFIKSESEFQPIIPKPSTADTISITINNTKHVNLPKDPNVFPKELNISSEIPSIPTIPKRSLSTSISSSSPESFTAKKAKRRKLLTEEEKKFNHLNSEQKRRALIKNAFDDLVSLLPIEIRSKKQPKSVVLETAASEIERMIEVNNELRRLLNDN